MSRILPARVSSWLLLANGVGLLGCPQLLDDDFGTSHGLPDRDAGICLDGRCELPFSGLAGSAGDAGGDDGGSAGASAGGEAGAGGNAGSSGAAGSGGSSGSSAGSGGSAGASGSAGAAGSAGSAGAAGTGGSAGAGGTGTGVDACWTLELTGNDDGQQSNCLDIHGWNNIQKDTGTTVALSYQDGDPCFVGTVSNASTGWGAVYIMTFADSEAGSSSSSTWNATSHNVTGFDFVYRGSKQPASLKVIYKDPGGTDFCEVIAPGDVAVPFADTTNCGNGSGSAVDTTRLNNITFAFPVSSQSYQVDFCMQISARN